MNIDDMKDPTMDNLFGIDCLDNDFFLVEDVRKIPFYSYPSRNNYFVSLICLQGEMEGSINLINYTFVANQHITIFPDQIVQCHRVSDDFSGLFMVTSRRFSESLELIGKDSIQVFLHLKEHPVTTLQSTDLELILDYYAMLKKTLRMKVCIHQREVVRLLFQAFFYNVFDIFNHFCGSYAAKKSRQEIIFEEFYKLVLKYYGQSREVGFYADKLCLTSKYLSTTIKGFTGKSAYEWINGQVVLEAKARLRSGSLSIQEISNSLSFPNPSFFGKYFKKQTGMSPGEYRSQKKL